MTALLPGPPEYLAAAIPRKCLAAWLPENPRPSPKSMPRFELKNKEKDVYYVSSFFLGIVFGGKIRNNGALLIKGSWCNGWVKASQNQGFKISLNGGPNFYRPFLLLYFLF